MVNHEHVVSGWLEDLGVTVRDLERRTISNGGQSVAGNRQAGHVEKRKLSGHWFLTVFGYVDGTSGELDLLWKRLLDCYRHEKSPSF